MIPDGAFDLVELDEITFDFPEITEAATYHLDLSVPETNMANTYELYCFPTLSTEIPASGTTIGEGTNEVHVTADYAEACALLQNGQKVLLLLYGFLVLSNVPRYLRMDEEAGCCRYNGAVDPKGSSGFSFFPGSQIFHTTVV